MITEQYQAILGIMQSLSGTGQPFSEVFSWPDAIPKQFPVAIVDILDGLQKDESTNAKVLVNNFIVRCIFRQQDASAAYLQRIQVTDQVLQAFTAEGVADYLLDTATKMDLKHDFFTDNSGDQPVFGTDFFITTEFIMKVS